MNAFTPFCLVQATGKMTHEVYAATMAVLQEFNSDNFRHGNSKKKISGQPIFFLKFQDIKPHKHAEKFPLKSSKNTVVT